MSAIHPFNRIAFFRHAFAAKPHLVLFLCALCVLCGEITAQDFKQLHPGVEHAQVEHKLGSDPVKINLLRLDLAKVRLDVHHALDTSIGTERTSSIATRHGAVAAINAGFYRLDTSIWAGEAAGILQIDGGKVSEALNDRVALFIINDLKRTGPDKSGVHFRHLSFEHYFTIGRSRINISGIDRERKANELIRYTSRFG